MKWLISNLNKLAQEHIPNPLRRSKIMAFIECIVVPFSAIQRDLLYQNQHNGQKIYLEKVLNDFYQVSGFDPTDHENTKLIYIENGTRPSDVYVFQDAEDDVIFLEDDEDSEFDVFLENDIVTTGTDFIIFIPDTIDYNEVDIAVLMERYCYYNGKQYTIETYTL